MLPAISPGMQFFPMMGPSERITIRSMTFSSWRTLPGQS